MLLTSTRQNFLLPVFILLFVIPCVGQRNPRKSSPAPKARKVIEIPFTDHSELSIQIGRFVKVLRKKPGSKAFVIVYERYPIVEYLKSASHVLSFAKSVFERYKIPPSRIVGIEGGFREVLMIELFIVPKGATPPVATPTIITKGDEPKQ
jgi:hypothetical protein